MCWYARVRRHFVRKKKVVVAVVVVVVVVVGVVVVIIVVGASYQFVLITFLPFVYAPPVVPTDWFLNVVAESLLHLIT